VSQPLMARKEPFVMGRGAISQLLDELQRTQDHIGVARESRWLRLGRRLGVGPSL
jgi:hypothetical protein